MKIVRRNPEPNAFETFFPAIKAGLQALQKLKPGKLRTAAKQGVRRNIQYYTEQGVTPIYSVAAKERAESLGLDINKIPTTRYGRIVGGEKHRPNILLEHTTPIGQLIERMVKEPEEKWAMTLFCYSPVCWVTREENDRLNKSGFSRKRPNGWKKCYEQCSIVIGGIVY